MAGVEAKQLFATDGVAQVKLVGANGERFTPDAKELGFDAVPNVRQRDVERGIQASAKAFSRGYAIDWGVFVPVRNPDVVD